MVLIAHSGEVDAGHHSDSTGYRHYRSDPAIRGDCSLLAACTSNAAATRAVTRYVWADARERTDANRLTSWGKAIYNAARRLASARLPTPSSVTIIAMVLTRPANPRPAAVTTHTSRRNPLYSANPKTKTRRKFRRASQQFKPAAEAAGHTPVLHHA